MGHDFKSEDSCERQSVSRRSFLRGSGAGAATTIMLDTSLPAFFDAQAQAAAPENIGPDAVAITLEVNKVLHALKVAPKATLAAVLRDNLNLTGTKIGCDRGACSACTVWLNNVPVASCMLLAVDVGSGRITTVEGLAEGGTLHPVQSAFISHDAMQCGFCTPGMVMSCAALVEANPNPSMDDVKGAISGHVCRCGSYPNIIAATLDAARNRKVKL